MTNDKELVEVWQSEFESIGELESFNFSKDDFGRYTSSRTDGRWQGFLLAKRTQPSVVLPKPDTVETSFNYGDFVTSRNVYDSDEVHAALTAAGIKYTIGE
jgi:hypothetical protein